MNNFIEGDSQDHKLEACALLSVHVKQSVSRYLELLSDHDVVDLHAMVIGEVEKPLLKTILEHFGYNQSKAAKALGLSRSTLRKKMDFYGLS